MSGDDDVTVAAVAAAEEDARTLHVVVLEHWL